MKKHYKEFFYSEDPKTLETERKKRRALHAIFPHLMGGSEDHTSYILLSDNTHTGIGNNNENKDTSIKKLPLFEKNKNALNWVNTKACSNNEQIRMNILENSNNNKTNPNTNKDLVGFNSQRRITNKIPHNNVSNISNFTQQKRKRRYIGVPTQKDYTKQINELKELLPKGVLDLLDNLGTKIEVIDNLHLIDEFGKRSNIFGIYTANKIILDSNHINVETLFAETIHAVQDYLNIEPSSNLEFQEHVLKDLYFRNLLYKTGDIKYSKALTACNTSDYENFINNIITNDGIDLNILISNINSFFDDFQTYYSNVPKYSKQGIDKLNYNWVDFLNILGIKYK